MIDQKTLDKELAPWKLRFPQPGYQRLLEYVEKMRDGTPIKRDRHRTAENKLVSLAGGYVVEDGIVESMPYYLRHLNPELRFVTTDHDISPDVVGQKGSTYDIKGYPSRDFVQAKRTTAFFYIFYLYHDTRCYLDSVENIVRAFKEEPSPLRWQKMIRMVPMSYIRKLPAAKVTSDLLVSPTIDEVLRKRNAEMEAQIAEAERFASENDNNIDFG